VSELQVCALDVEHFLTQRTRQHVYAPDGIEDGAADALDCEARECDTASRIEVID
jgi:hypothetical protein